MLEHLAAVARTRGIDTFVAETLPEQPPHARRVPRRRLPGRPRVRRRRRARDVPDRPDRSVAGDAGRAGADLRGAFGAAAAGAPLDRGDRRGPPAGDDRPRGVPQPARRRVHRAGLPGQPARRRRRQRSGLPDDPRRARRRRPRRRHGAGRVRGRRRRAVRGQGRARPHRHQRRVRRARQRRDRTAARRARPPSRHAARRAERHGRGQHPPRRLDERDLRAVPAGAGTDRLRVAVGRARHRAARPGRRASGSASRPSCPWATRPT